MVWIVLFLLGGLLGNALRKDKEEEMRRQGVELRAWGPWETFFWLMVMAVVLGLLAAMVRDS